MPIYEFYCENCKKKVEEFRKIGDDERRCSCGKRMRKLMSVPGSRFRFMDTYDAIRPK